MKPDDIDRIATPRHVAARPPGTPQAIDYLGDPALEAFFDAREHEAYYVSLKSVDQRRGFHDRLVVALARVLALVDDQAAPIIDEILARNFREQRRWMLRVDRPLDPIEEVRAEEPVGVQLLGVSDTLDFASLRAAYRAAALRMHPDRGGSDAEMTAVNNAYELLHARLSEQTLISDTTVFDVWAAHDTPPTTHDYLWSVTRRLFDVCLDDWALDEASDWLEQLTVSQPVRGSVDPLGSDALVAPDPPQLPSKRERRLDSKRHAEASSYDRDLIDLIQPSAKLAERLTASQLYEAAQRALGVAEMGLLRARARGLNYDFYVRKAKEVVAGQRKPRFVLNHPRQLDNALRLGAIDKHRYAANLERITTRQAAADLDRLMRAELLSTTAFVQGLPTDRGLAMVDRETQLVPHPGWYQGRVEELTAEQQAEYLRAFGTTSELALVEKYAWVRLSSLLRSAIYFLATVDPAALADEVTLLGRLQPRCVWYAERASHVVTTLAQLDGGSAQELAQELRRLLEPDEPRRSGQVSIVFMSPAVRETTPRFFDEAERLSERFVGRG